MEQVEHVHRWKDVKPEHHAFHHANEDELVKRAVAEAAEWIRKGYPNAIEMERRARRKRDGTA